METTWSAEKFYRFFFLRVYFVFPGIQKTPLLSEMLSCLDLKFPFLCFKFDFLIGMWSQFYIWLLFLLDLM